MAGRRRRRPDVVAADGTHRRRRPPRGRLRRPGLAGPDHRGTAPGTRRRPGLALEVSSPLMRWLPGRPWWSARQTARPSGSYRLSNARTATGRRMTPPAIRWCCPGRSTHCRAAPALDHLDLGEAEYALRSAVRSAADALTSLQLSGTSGDPRSLVDEVLQANQHHRVPDHAPTRRSGCCLPRPTSTPSSPSAPD